MVAVLTSVLSGFEVGCWSFEKSSRIPGNQGCP